MLLTAEERTFVRDALVGVLNTHQDQRAILGVFFAGEPARIPGELPLLSSPGDYAEATLTVCLRYGTTPPLLRTLLERLVERGQGGQRMADLAQRVATGVDPNPNAYEDTWLDGGRPFFDRTLLRSQLRNVVLADGGPLYRVRAQQDAFGRSYSRTFIEHVAARTQGATQVLYASLSPGTGPTYQARDLALDLLFPLGITDEPPERTDSSNPRAIARWTLGKLTGSPNRWILVLDGFGQPDVNPDVVEAIKALAELTPYPVVRHKVRLVLLDFDEPLPGDPALCVEELLTPSTAISAADLEPVVLAISERRAAAGRSTIAAADIPAIVGGIVANAAPAGRQRMQDLNAGLMKVWTFEEGQP